MRPSNLTTLMTPRSKETTVLAPTSPAQNGFSLIPNQKLLQLYSTMLKYRILVESPHIILKQNKLAAVIPASPGCEAAAVGVTIDLLSADTLAPPLGDLIPIFVNALPLEAILAGLFNPIVPAPSASARLKIATDAARTNKLKKNCKIAVALSNNEPTSLGPWHRALSFAGLHDLPMIFGCWNHRPLRTERTKNLGFPIITVDGNDVVAVYRVASEAITHARNGNGPTLIECLAYPLNPGDPILNMEQYLANKGLFSDKFKRDEAAKFRKELETAMESARNSARLHAFLKTSRVIE
jgi:TPP-dependent pyruvate/acetoin dehydrogenase alpha subunit